MFELLTASAIDVSAFTKLERIADAPFNLFCNTVVSYGDGIYVMGGFGGPDAGPEQPNLSLFFFNVKTGTWIRRANVPDVLNRSAACFHNGLIWVIGSTKLMTYDPVTNVWVSRFNMPYPLYSSRLIPHGDYLYFIGGERGGDSISEEFTRYHIPSATLSAVNPPGAKPIPHGYFGAVKAGDYMYMHGGYRPAAQPPAGQTGHFWRYDFNVGTWEQLPASLGVDMHTHQIRYARGKIITGGAYRNADDSGQTYEYNIAKRTWIKGKKMPYSGWWLNFEVVGDVGYLLGGSSNASASGATPQIWKLS